MRSFTVADLELARAALTEQRAPPSLREQHRVDFEAGLNRLHAKAQDAHLIAMLEDRPPPTPSPVLRAAVHEALAYAEWRRTAAINYCRAMS